MPENYYWSQNTKICVSKLLLLSAICHWCQETTIGVSNLPLVSENFYWCQQILSCSYPCTISSYQLNTAKCTHVLLNRHFINTVHNCIIFKPLKGHLQGEQLIHSSNVVQHKESPNVKFNLLQIKLNFTTGKSCC